MRRSAARADRIEVTAAERLVYGLGRRMEPESFKPFVLSKDLKLEPGQAVDLGPIDVNTGKRSRGCAAAQAPTTDVPINRANRQSGRAAGCGRLGEG